jgi:hypothetical protein
MKEDLTGRQRVTVAPPANVTANDLRKVLATSPSGVAPGTVVSYDAEADGAVVAVAGLSSPGTYVNYSGVALAAGNKVLVTVANNIAVVMSKRA